MVLEPLGLLAALTGPTFGGPPPWRPGEAYRGCDATSSHLHPSGSPGYVRVPVTAGDVQGCPACLITLMNVGSIFDQQLHALQVSREHSFVQSGQAWAGVKAEVLELAFPCHPTHPGPGALVLSPEG